MIKFSHEYQPICQRTLKVPHYFCDTCEMEYEPSDLREDIDGEMICKDCWIEAWREQPRIHVED